MKYLCYLVRKVSKSAELKIDSANDRINVFGKVIHLHITNSGHYAIPLNETNLNLKTPSLQDSKFVEVPLIIEHFEDKANKEKKHIASKLHNLFGYPKSARLTDLTKATGISDNDLLTNLDKSCEIYETQRTKFKNSGGVFISS